MKRNFVHLIISSIILLSASCTPYFNSHIVTPTFTSTMPLSSTSAAPSAELPIGDGGLLYGKPCESPCFFGVRLEETKFDEIIPILKNNGLSPCIKDLRFDNSKSVVCGGVDKPKVKIVINEDSRLVVGIRYLPSTTISVGDIIAKYGEPSYVQVLQGQYPPGDWLMTATLYWDKLAMEVCLPPIEVIGEHKYQIERMSNIDSIYFEEEEDYQRFSREGSEAWRGYDFYSKSLQVQ